eukprot:CAMPEP_0114973272 /NCGR_PEP_ID=MMETSP0216-20121206/864_1 /TAXON_ID=223996 /ORGANISM="Protocruzia adherens, Strain Boccale" /LENGTH=153 /DNA_ID=CAMNT_0002333749 /DNA_START=190 /DNA_END=651 /DNA_ORIENTATION=+
MSCDVGNSRSAYARDANDIKCLITTSTATNEESQNRKYNGAKRLSHFLDRTNRFKKSSIASSAFATPSSSITTNTEATPYFDSKGFKPRNSKYRSRKRHDEATFRLPALEKKDHARSPSNLSEQVREYKIDDFERGEIIGKGGSFRENPGLCR